MTPREKAEQLIQDYRDENYHYEKAILANSKDNALICVNEIVSALESMKLIFSDRELILAFWKEVKTEIENL